MKMPKSCARVLLILISLLGSSSPVSASQLTLTALHPGQFQYIDQNLQINVVFVGYHPGSGPRDIDEAAFREVLPGGYRSVNRIPHIYGLDSPTGLRFTYNYNLVYASKAFEDAYFSHISSIGKQEPITLFQDLYNHQQAHSLHVDQNLRIDATAAEKWLGDHALPMLGVDPTQYTIFYINWYGRPDFKFHGYTDAHEPDPDTGVNWGTTDLFVLKDFNNLAGWGGTTPDDPESGLGSLRRTWFFDLSAGPEGIEDNWNVDDADTTGDGQLDYRLPPVWDYGKNNGYRPFDNLSQDLGFVTRFVGINQLFTTSPIYNVALSAPKLPSSIKLGLTLFQGDPELDGKARLHPDFILAKLSRLQPLNTFSLSLQERPLAGNVEDIFKDWIAFTPSYGKNQNALNSYFGDFYLYYQSHANQFLTGGADYEVPVLLMMSATSYWPPDRCQCSYADDNYRDGTQTMIFANLSNFFATRGYGFSSLVTHEVGHHLGMSHPHDGYDSELDFDYSRLDVAFAELGQESATVMGYTWLNLDFDQFDRDNMNRNLTAAYLNHANAILAKILASPRSKEVNPLLVAADQQAAVSLNIYQTMDYASAVFYAKDAYSKILAAAALINVRVEQQASPADYKAHGSNYMFTDDFTAGRRR